MLIKLVSLSKDKLLVNLRVEQETAPNNSFNPTIELHTHEVEGLTDDEIITKAWLRIKSTLEVGFKRVNEAMDIEWIDEEITLNGFEFKEVPSIPIVVPPASEIMSFEEMMLWKAIEQNNRILELEKKLA